MRGRAGLHRRAEGVDAATWTQCLLKSGTRFAPPGTKSKPVRLFGSGGYAAPIFHPPPPFHDSLSSTAPPLNPSFSVRGSPAAVFHADPGRNTCRRNAKPPKVPPPLACKPRLSEFGNSSIRSPETQKHTLFVPILAELRPSESRADHSLLPAVESTQLCTF